MEIILLIVKPKKVMLKHIVKEKKKSRVEVRILSRLAWLFPCTARNREF